MFQQQDDCTYWKTIPCLHEYAVQFPKIKINGMDMYKTQIGRKMINQLKSRTSEKGFKKILSFHLKKFLKRQNVWKSKDTELNKIKSKRIL